MATAKSTSKSARIETRVSLAQKHLIERAAAVSGRTVSAFVLAHIEVAAKKVIDEHEKLHLDQVCKARYETKGISSFRAVRTL